ncbi:hypothetical protein GCM10009759_08780 [Kitasatospora saccharophila]|uniref:Uncharacterized protein n=1 Tax=Kitasatospora saccharophila TaxID=407973 RepID=A0ABN2WBZ1_9ACTN
MHLPACELEPLHAFDELLYALGRDAAGRYDPAPCWASTGPTRRSSAACCRSPAAAAGTPCSPTRARRRTDGCAPTCSASRGRDGCGTGCAPRSPRTDALVLDPDTAEPSWTDAADCGPADPWRRAVEDRLERELPHWRTEPWPY